MKVIATARGFFGRLREVDEEFEVPNGEKASWFTPVKNSKPRAKQADNKAEDLT